MVDTYGRWTYEPNTAENKKCWLDRIADWVRSTKYTIETTLDFSLPFKRITEADRLTDFWNDYFKSNKTYAIISRGTIYT